MPGLIESRRYTDRKAALCQAHARLEQVIEAVEWQLMGEPSFDHYPLVRTTALGPVRLHHLTSIEPGIVVVFGFEEFQSDLKVVLLDLWVPDVINEDDSE